MSYQSERFSSLMQAAAALVAGGKYTVKAAVTESLVLEREIDNQHRLAKEEREYQAACRAGHGAEFLEERKSCQTKW